MSKTSLKRINKDTFIWDGTTEYIIYISDGQTMLHDMLFSVNTIIIIIKFQVFGFLCNPWTCFRLKMNETIFDYFL